MQDHGRILALYQRYREVSRRLSKLLVKSLSRDAFTQGAKELGMLQEGAIALDSEADMDILADYCVHEYREGGRNSVQRLLETSPPPVGSEDALVLQAMVHAF